ncbi:hypothetical protein AB6A40_000110 [Gnathostoma spinigerum]|uniref:DUF7627 domain-containing protein n=1 Tax=Gnathostoma spinigerum TaxID=75299 RepID=A0ABD6E2P3_9BILA
MDGARAFHRQYGTELVISKTVFAVFLVLFVFMASSCTNDESQINVAPDSQNISRSGRRRANNAMEKNRRMLESIQITLNGGKSAERKNMFVSRRSKNPTAELRSDAIAEKLLSLCSDRVSSLRDIEAFVRSHDLNSLTEDDWQTISSFLLEAGTCQDAFQAVDGIVALIKNPSFQAIMGPMISSAMSEFVLNSSCDMGNVIELVSLLLTSRWPHHHERFTLESNAVLYHVISALKGWMNVVSDENEEDEELIFRCASGLAQVCLFSQRKLWINYPEFADDLYAVFKNALTSGSRTPTNARVILLDALLEIHSWGQRGVKTMKSICTQTPPCHE